MKSRQGDEVNASTEEVFVGDLKLVLLTDLLQQVLIGGVPGARQGGMSRAVALESDLFESLRSKSILIRHGMHSFTKTHYDMLRSLYPASGGASGGDGHEGAEEEQWRRQIWDMITNFLTDECAIVHSKIQAQRSSVLLPLFSNAVAVNMRARTGSGRPGLSLIHRVVQDSATHDDQAFQESASRHRPLYDAVNTEIARLTTRLRDKATETPSFDGKVGVRGLEVQVNEASEVIAIESKLALWNRLRGVMMMVCCFQ